MEGNVPGIVPRGDDGAELAAAEKVDLSERRRFPERSHPKNDRDTTIADPARLVHGPSSCVNPRGRMDGPLSNALGCSTCLYKH